MTLVVKAIIEVVVVGGGAAGVGGGRPHWSRVLKRAVELGPGLASLQPAGMIGAGD